MTVGKKKFIDSYMFIQLPLASFPKTFGLTELKKGYFPHLLTCKEALFCVGAPGKCPAATQMIVYLLYERLLSK